MPKVIDFVKRAEKQEKRAARIARRVQSASPFRTSTQITGLPNHEYREVDLRVERRGWSTWTTKALRHERNCQRCLVEIRRVS